jgi:hypothetical protein
MTGDETMMDDRVCILRTILAASLLVAAGACGSSSDSGGAGGSSTATGAGGTSSTTGAGATSSSSTGSAGDGAGGGAALDCASYCAEVAANCTTTHEQFTDSATCMGTCAAYPVGAVSDTSGNTLGCRYYHGGAAMADPTTHCPHAGLTGGDNDPTDATAGTCGEACDNFCTVALAVCMGQPSAYATKDDCMMECKQFAPDATDYNTSDTGNNDYGCRVYHLTAASADASSAATHCPHIHLASATCTM